MEEEKALWGFISKEGIDESPLRLLEEQATYFNNRFPKGELICTAKEDAREIFNPFDPSSLSGSTAEEALSSPNVTVRMYIEVPSLNYKLQLLKVTYKVYELYPCALTNLLEGPAEECADINQFRETLSNVLKNAKVLKTISTLFSQAKENPFQ